MPPKFLIGIVLTAVLTTLVATSGRADEAPRTINVSGLGQVEAEPDMATITIGVTAQDAAAAEAVRQVNASMSRLLPQLRDLGVEDRHVQTQQVSLSPLWSNRSSNADEPPRIKGYAASNTLAVTIVDLDRLGPVLDAVLKEGANQFNGLRFGVQDPAPLQSEARALAVAQARQKAEELATAAGVRLGPVLNISDGQGGRPGPAGREMAALASDTPIARGEITISANVNMRFAIADE